MGCSRNSILKQSRKLRHSAHPPVIRPHARVYGLPTHSQTRHAPKKRTARFVRLFSGRYSRRTSGHWPARLGIRDLRTRGGDGRYREFESHPLRQEPLIPNGCAVGALPTYVLSYERPPLLPLALRPRNHAARFPLQPHPWPLAVGELAASLKGVPRLLASSTAIGF
jgi:hypothetical protein